MAAKNSRGKQSSGLRRESKKVVVAQPTNGERFGGQAQVEQFLPRLSTFGVLQARAESQKDAVVGRCSAELQEACRSLAEEMRKVPLEQRTQRSILIDFQRRIDANGERFLAETALGWT